MRRSPVRQAFNCLGVAISLNLFPPCQLPATASSDQSPEPPTLLIVVGAAGEKGFGEQFAHWADLWTKAGEQAGARTVRIGPATNSLAEAVLSQDLQELEEYLRQEAKESAAELWLVLIGHGTFDGREAKFNLRGPDLTPAKLAGWLRPFHRPLAILNLSSSSGPFINQLSLPGRVIVTATRSGHEQNYARLGSYLSQAIADPQADLDKDGQTSLLEAFLTASHQVQQFFENEGRLATEHSLIDDNGDGLGTPADWFEGVRAVKKAENSRSPDGSRARQFHLVRSESERKLSPEIRKRRDQLELELIQLRESKNKWSEEEYYQRLEQLLVQLARLYHD